MVQPIHIKGKHYNEYNKKRPNKGRLSHWIVDKDEENRAQRQEHSEYHPAKDKKEKPPVGRGQRTPEGQVTRSAIH